MTLYKTGRSTDYKGSEERPARRPGPCGTDHTAEAVEQFTRMANGYVAKCADAGGMAIAWVKDSTLTEEQRAWCRETAQQIKREAELAKVKRPKPQQSIGARGLGYNRAAREALIARVLERYPDATVNQIVVTTGLQRPTVMKSEAWAMAQMGREVKE